MRTMKRILCAAALACGALVAGAGSARADIIPELSSITAEGSNFRFAYQADVTINQRVEVTDFFTIYDFAGFVPGSNQQPAGWSFSAQLIGVTPAQVLPNDDASLFNLTWTRTGGTISGGPQSLGIFSAVSTFNTFSLDDYVGRGTFAGGPADGQKTANIGPNGIGVAANPIPEPATMLLLGTGLAGIGGMVRKRRAAKGE